MEKAPLSSSLPNMSTHWDDHSLMTKKRDRPIIIGVAGGTASGKTSVCEVIVNRLGIDHHRVAIISQDCFYKPLTIEQQKSVHKYNFDHPDAFDFDLIEETLKNLRDGKPVPIPIYDFCTHSRKSETTNICAIDIILFEGILVFYQQRIMHYMNMKIFVDTDADTRLARRIARDIKSRGRDLDGVLHQYQTFVKPSFDEYILPTKKYADVIIPRGADNIVAIDLIVQHIKTKLGEKSRKLQNKPYGTTPKRKSGGGKKSKTVDDAAVNVIERLDIATSEHFTFDHFDEEDDL